MLELKLTDVECMLEALTCRTEKHGQDDVPAVTLKLSMSLPAAMLSFFSPTLEEHLFDKENIQKDIFGDGARLRYPHIDYPLTLDYKMSGANISIEYGVGTPMTYDDAVIDDFHITPMDGGTVVMVCKVGFRASPEHEAKLYASQRRKLTWSVSPLEVPAALPGMKDAA